MLNCLYHPIYVCKLTSGCIHVACHGPLNFQNHIWFIELCRPWYSISFQPRFDTLRTMKAIFSPSNTSSIIIRLLSLQYQSAFKHITTSQHYSNLILASYTTNESTSQMLIKFRIIIELQLWWSQGIRSKFFKKNLKNRTRDHSPVYIKLVFINENNFSPSQIVLD